ncbi:MAG TPA: hypothetical protein VNZ58_11385, partial [Thermomicrobiales bacterium]|nr:hypothetical protein [Thermomicrobiales bacterium]
MSSEDMMWDDMYLAAVESDLLRLKEEMNGFLAYAQVVNSSGDTAKSQTLNRMLGLADGWIGYPVHVAGMPHSTGAQAIEDDYLAFSYEVAALGTQWYVVVNSPSEAEFQNAFKTFCNMHDRVTAQGDDLFFTVSAAISVNLDGRDRSTVGRPVDGYRPVDVLLPRERPVLFSD